jgi:hypothetical protein
MLFAQVRLLSSLTHDNGTIAVPGLEDQGVKTSKGKTLIEPLSFDVSFAGEWVH